MKLISASSLPDTGDETISQNPWERSPRELPTDSSDKPPVNEEASTAPSSIINRITNQPELLARLSLKTNDLDPSSNNNLKSNNIQLRSRTIEMANPTAAASTTTNTTKSKEEKEVIIIPTFNGNNFSNWQATLSAYLELKKLWYTCESVSLRASQAGQKTA
ncbi:hypothetical protein PGT21_001646 [Puccinia graminis f. sp. tritici]|uniref:DUF4219 domain-containing protein n=1 Tax=Puccinia graminis f. sp. tritici TaxID=56615 RepID=A0A5B0QMH6_PUCGR|nr:hypothetical protein PGT21_001646 [Puccinia graminis f. sp. tritici]